MSNASGDPTAVTTGWDEAISKDWLQGGTNESDYLQPWRLAALIAEEEAPATPVVLDVASGPGGFLGVALEVLPTAEGIWLDNFKTMEDEARSHLAPLGNRVRFELGDLLDVERMVPPGSVYLALTSRATHHLEPEALRRFYAGLHTVLAPGGWLANLDSMMGSDDPWRTRFRNVRRKISPNLGTTLPGHPPGYPFRLEDHVNAASSSGFGEIRPVWQLCQHAMIMARKPGSGIP